MALLEIRPSLTPFCKAIFIIGVSAPLMASSVPACPVVVSRTTILNLVTAAVAFRYRTETAKEVFLTATVLASSLNGAR